MANNDWYEQNPSDAGKNATPPEDAGRYDDKPSPYPPAAPKHKEKRLVTLWQFIACMLVVALLSSASVAFLLRMGDRASSGGQALISSGSTTLDESAASSGSTAPSAAPSSGLKMSSTPAQYNSTTEMLRSCMACIVGVDTVYEATTSYDYFTDSAETTASGSGVILTADGYIVTNNHVVEGASSITVHLQDGAEYQATLIGADSRTDLAILKIEGENLPAAVLGNSGNALVGESVYAIGNPLGVFSSSVSSGIISGLDRVIEIDGQEMTLMQTDAAVNPGNSGGGLFNSAGELIGIINAKSSSIDVEGLGFAIPIDGAKVVIADLIDYGYVKGRPYLGINMQNIYVSSGGSSGSAGGGSGNGFGFPFGGYPGNYVNRVQVLSVEKGSAAEKAGIQANDIIIAINGTEVSSSTDLTVALYEYKAKDVVTITVQRGTETIDMTVTLGERTK